MEAKELKVGNIIYDHRYRVEREVTAEDFERVEHKHYSFEYFQAIPINENWIRSFGFKIQEIASGIRFFDLVTIDGPLCMVVSGDHLILSCRKTDNTFVDLGTRVRFVHQLQNLYSATAFEEILMPVWK